MDLIKTFMIIAETICCILAYIGYKKDNHLMCKSFCYMVYIFFALYWIIWLIEMVIK